VKHQNGFSLMELMIVVAIIGILAGIALPSYSDYLIRSRIAIATSELASKRTLMEQYFQDNHTYNDTANCVTDYKTTDFFKFSCTGDATTYTLTGTGQSKMSGFTYSVTQADAKSTTVSGAPSGWSAHSPNNCWVTGKGGVC